MFGMGWQEILVVVAIAVLVIGPDQLPQVARTIGKVFAQFKRAANDLRTAVSEEVSQHQELADFKEFSADIESEVRGFTHAAEDYIDKEMKEGEKELETISQEITASDGDPGPLSDPLPTYDHGADGSSAEKDGGEKPTAVKTAKAAKAAKAAKSAKTTKTASAAKGKGGGRKAGSTRKETA